MKLSQKSALAFIAVTSIVAAIPASAADLNGQAVHLDYLFPSTASVYENDGAQTVTSSGVTFTTSGGVVHTNVKPSQIVVTFGPHGRFFAPASFNGIHLYEVGGAPITFTSVVIDPATHFTGFDASRLSFDATNIFANFQSLGLDSANNLTLDLNGYRPSAVPEASQFASLGLGVLGVGVLMLRTRKRQTTA